MKAESLMPLAGEVEADETFVGGVSRSSWKARSGFVKLEHGPATGKATVFGMVQRSRDGKPSQARAMVVPNHKASSLIPKIYANVVTGSTLYTDALRSYRQTDRDFVHDFYRPLCGLRQRSRSHEHHRKLLVLREAHAARDVYRRAAVPS